MMCIILNFNGVTQQADRKYLLFFFLKFNNVAAEILNSASFIAIISPW